MAYEFYLFFFTKPKHIFLVHGEPEGQIVLKQKILEKTHIPVTIPEFGEVYELTEDIKVRDRLEMPEKYKFIRLEILQKLDNIEAEVEEMKNIVKSEKLSEDTSDEEILKLKEKIHALEQQIVNVIS